MFLPLLAQSVDAVNQTGVMASVTIKSNTQIQTSANGDSSPDIINTKGDGSVPQEQEDTDSSKKLNHAVTDRDNVSPSNMESTTIQDNYEIIMNMENKAISKNEIQYIKEEPKKLLLFNMEALGIPVAAAITGSMVTAWMISNSGITNSFNLKPLGFSAAALKSYYVSRRYKTLFRKTQMPLALAFVSLASGSVVSFFNAEITSYVLYSAFYGLIAYHLRIWYSTTSYSRVPKEILQLLIVLLVLGMSGYSYLLAAEVIQYNTFQVITMTGFLMVTPLAIFTSLAYRGSRIYLKWVLLSTGLGTVMAGLVLSSIFWIGDILVLTGCGCVIISQTILSTKFAVAKN